MHVVEKEFKDFIENLSFSHFYIAYSGGVDSQVILHLASKYLKGNFTALHVNHGISSNSKKWEDFCKKESNDFGAKIKVAHFELANEKANLEEKARTLRHAFFEENVSDDECLFTGHHLDDQAETFMLRLMRGSGIDGLSSMQATRPMKKGTLARPLLNVSKEEIIEYAKLKELSWVEDESNKSSDYDRNFIRNEVMPLLKTRWSSANKSIVSSVNHCQDVKKAQKEEDEVAFVKVVNEHNRIDIKELKKLSSLNQNRLIRFWLGENNKKMVDKKALSVILNEVAFSSYDNSACFSKEDYEIRKANGFLYLINDSDKDINFTCLDVSVKVMSSEDKMNSLLNDDFKIEYKGSMRKFKYVMKDQKIPYWLRNMYIPFVKDNVIVAFGDIVSSSSNVIISKK